MTIDSFTGTGMPFPFAPTPRGGFPLVTGEEVIRQSIETILDTDPGERIMRPDFGCGLRRYLMEPNSAATRASMQQDIDAALSRWEPRILVTNVAVTPGEERSLVWIAISYVRLADRREDNLVYPFYLS
jgi:phage baseplate assembly protein W